MTNSNSSDRTRWTDEQIDELALARCGEVPSPPCRDSSVADLRSSAESLLQIAQIHQNDIEALGRDNRGLQLEVRRLVEELRQGRSEGGQPG